MTIPRVKLSNLVLAGAVFAVVLTALALVNRTVAPPPARDATQESTSEAGSTQTRIRSLEAAIEEGRGTASSYTQLGAALLQRARENGDPGLYGRAEQAFRKALEREPRSFEAKVGLGNLALAQHDFRAALRQGQAARALAPRAFAPFSVLFDAQLELGRYRSAGRTLERMIDFKPGVASYARASYFRELHGDLRGAREAMRLAVAAAPSGSENAAYLRTLLGHLDWQRGRVGAAQSSYEMALADFPDYPPALAGLARVDASRGRYERAIEGLRGVSARLPLPEYVIALAETELAAGRRAEGRRDLELVRAERRLLAASGVNTDTELAIFEADHGDRRTAGRMARRGYSAAPSVRSADALGWALTRAGRPGEGLRYAREALRLGWRDPLVLYHAGLAARAAGAPVEARRLLERALELNPRFSPLHAPRARRALEGLR